MFTTHHSILKKSCSKEISLTFFIQQFPNLFDHGTYFMLYTLNEFFGAEVGKFR